MLVEILASHFKFLKPLTACCLSQLKVETISIVSHIENVWVPGQPKGVNQADILSIFDSGHHNPILATLEHNHHSCQLFGVHMEGTDGSYPTN
jgi:hypothetical protein